MKRNSFLRRSLNAIKSRTSSRRRSSFAVSLISAQSIPEEDDELLLGPEKKFDEENKENTRELGSYTDELMKTTIFSEHHVIQIEKHEIPVAPSVHVEKRRESRRSVLCPTAQPPPTTSRHWRKAATGHHDDRICSTRESAWRPDRHVATRQSEPCPRILHRHRTEVWTDCQWQRDHSCRLWTRQRWKNYICEFYSFIHEDFRFLQVRSIRQLFLDGCDDRVRVIPLAQRYKLAGIGVMPFPEGDNRLPHIVSLVSALYGHWFRNLFAFPGHQWLDWRGVRVGHHRSGVRCEFLPAARVVR